MLLFLRCLRFIQFQPHSQSLEPPNLNLPAEASKSKQEDSALPSLHHDSSIEAATDQPHSKHEVERYPVTTVDFSRVEIPFIIGIWILFASIAKIGKWTNRNKHAQKKSVSLSQAQKICRHVTSTITLKNLHFIWFDV